MYDKKVGFPKSGHIFRTCFACVISVCVLYICCARFTSSIKTSIKLSKATDKATAMKLLVSHQPILQECMRLGGLTYYFIIIIIICMVVLIIILLAITCYELQVHLSGC